MTSYAVYLFPFAIDIVVGLVLFVGRHSLATAGASESEVASIPLFFGIGYFLSGPLMRKFISHRLAKPQMLLALALLTGCCVLLAWAERILPVQVLFCAFPFAVSLFFNAFQAYLVGFSLSLGRPVSVTVSLYTVAWSMGIGLGPFISGLLRDRLAWAEIYYFAAAASLLIGVVVLFLRSGDSEPQVTAAAGPGTVPGGPRFHLSGWMGVVIGLIGWLVIATYWPVMAAEAGISPSLKGIVEFAWAGVQSLGALLLMKLGHWQLRPRLLPLFGVIGGAGLIIFGTAQSAGQFLIGASVMGLFTATTFVYSLYHSMRDPMEAPKRVAVNEMMVGLGYIVAPVITTLLHDSGAPFSLAFIRAAFLLMVLVGIQTAVATRIGARSSRRP